MKSEDEVEINIGHGVSRKYWMEERGFSLKDYKQIIRNCIAGNFGSCEACMGNIQCEIRVKGKYTI